MRRLALLLPIAAALAAPAQGATRLRLDGIGPLKLGMARLTALDTGWLAGRHSGCPLGGKPYPVDYRLTGTRAPAGLRGTAEFVGGKLTGFSFSAGVRTATGVQVGTTTLTGMITRYRNAGYRVSARYVPTFQGTFVTVRRKSGGRSLIGGFADHKIIQILGVPFVPVCE